MCYNGDVGIYMKRYIISDPDILGGKPVIVGTRIPITQILLLLKNGFTVEAIHEEYPQLDKKTISGAVEEAALLFNKKNVSSIL